ncbi:MAG: hypothetical protein M3Q49_19915 [Actinomycetota bacterium]|nr:hypothetical protein [Actinomycetota bacterium]MDP9488025.1 hypothetical protein [Actinomycetota bacterium]
MREVLAEEGMEEEAEVKLVKIRTDEEARRLRFPGSPTVRVDGRDLFASPGGAEEGRWGFG